MALKLKHGNPSTDAHSAPASDGVAQPSTVAGTAEQPAQPDAQEAARVAEAARAAFGEAAARDLGPWSVEEDVLYVQPWGVEEDALYVQMAFGAGAKVVAALWPPRGCSRFFCAASWTDCGSLRPSQRARGRKRDAPDSETVVGESTVS